MTVASYFLIYLVLNVLVDIFYLAKGDGLYHSHETLAGGLVITLGLIALLVIFGF